MTDYRGAVLIVGSLWWDKLPIRENWRNTRLDMENKQTVYAPIRYGKKSDTWGGTYTMVFSQLCYRNAYGLGTALLVPFQRTVRTADELIQEASELWKAEAKENQNISLAISASWGAVGLLTRPNSQIPDAVIQDWSRHYGTTSRFRSTQTKTEKPVLDEKGLLKLRWLVNADKNSPVEFDFILATATKATLIHERYPSAKTIADAWQKDQDDNVRYFRNNRSNGIITFQDDTILKFLST
jgi:hypothetical protein